MMAENEVANHILEEFFSDGLRCPKCQTLLNLKPFYEQALLAAKQEMLEAKAVTVDLRLKMPGSIECLPCRQEGDTTVIYIRH
jgi:hypothetical protein